MPRGRWHRPGSSRGPLTLAGIRAVKAAGTPTEGAVQALHAAREAGRHVAIVSNNSAECVWEYRTRQGIAEAVDEIVGRPVLRPELLKPSAHPLLSAATSLRVAPGRAVLRRIGYANKPRKHITLVGADVVVVVVVVNVQEIAASLAAISAAD
ncbi:HAD family hydrolase [Streptomyces sp. NPDC001903]|uniref:HAD family hydrolase n=1 Tax=Streptomyces sp. NPDC001903 TaxID=3364622 RepID=UPI0036C59173